MRKFFNRNAVPILTSASKTKILYIKGYFIGRYFIARVHCIYTVIFIYFNSVFWCFQAPSSYDNGQPQKKQRLEGAAAAVELPGVDAVKEIQEKVRAIATQVAPSESLLVSALDDLSKAAADSGHHQAHLFRQTAYEAKMNQGKIDMPAFVLEVLGKGVSDSVSRALSKTLKKTVPVLEKSPERKPKESARPSSPLSNLYPQSSQDMFSQALSFLQAFPPASFGHRGYRGGYRGSYRGGYGGGYGRGRGQAQGGYACYFCGSAGHFVRECEKMKEAAAKNK